MEAGPNELGDMITNNKKNDVVKLPKNHLKYLGLLKFLNIILTNIGKENINDITDFIDIDREDIIKQINKESLEEFEDELFLVFSKKDCHYSKKGPSFVLNILRHMTKIIGYEFCYKKTGGYIKVDGIKKHKTSYLYSIK